MWCVHSIVTNSMRLFFQKHERNILLVTGMLLMSTVFSIRHLVIPMHIDDAVYAPITFAATSDQAIAYGPRMVAALQGAWPVGDINIAEVTASPSYLPIANPYIMALFVKVAGSLTGGIVLSDIFLPAAMFATVFALLQMVLLGHVRGAFIGALVFMFAPHIGAMIPPLSLGQLQQTVIELLPTFGPHEGLFFSRFEYPKVSFLFFALAQLALFRVVQFGRRSDVFFAGLAIASLFYTDLYHWVATFTAGGLMVLFFAIQKDWKRVRLLFASAAIGLVGSVYYWFNLMQVAALPHFDDLSARIGLEIGHNLRFITWKSYVRAIALSLVLWTLFRKKERRLAIFLSAWLLSIIVVLNAQVIVGVNPQPDHWIRTQLLTLFVSWVVIIRSAVKRWGPFIPSKIGIVFALSFVATVMVHQLQSSTDRAHVHTRSADREAAYDWLRNKTVQGSVIASLDVEVNNELQLYTQNRLYYPNGFNTVISNDEIWERYLQTNRLFNQPVEDVAEAISPGSYMLTHLFHNGYREDTGVNSYILGYSLRRVPEQEYAMRIQQYIHLQEEDFEPTHRLNYVLLTDDSQEIAIDGTLVFANGAMRIVQVNQDEL